MGVHIFARAPWLRSGRGGFATAVSAIALISAGSAAAQTAAAPQAADEKASDDAIIVTGIRGSAESAVRIKRNSDTVVDAITAEDIGALPDKSITETLQRIPGVSVNRFARLNDPDHVSQEGQSPVIRGLPYVASQFNGRDAFTANGGRALNFQDIPPDLASAVEVYKNQTADQIEGGIAGVINIVTRRPLDSTKDFYVLNANINYGDKRKKGTPEISGVVSKQWDTGIGRIGILGSASYSKIDERTDNARVTTYQRYRTGILDPNFFPPVPGFDGNGKRIYTFANGSTTRVDPCTTGSGYSVQPSSRIGYAGEAQRTSDGRCVVLPGLTGATPGVDYYVPLGGGYSRQDNDRKRIGASAALEWESTDGSMQATLQWIHSDTKQLYTERTIAPVEDAGASDIIGGVSSAVFDANNVMLKGIIGGGGGTGIMTQELNRGSEQRAITNDFSGHLKWDASDRLHFDFDGQYAKSSSRMIDASLVAVSDTVMELDNTGSIPRTTFRRPANYAGNGTYVDVIRNDKGVPIINPATGLPYTGTYVNGYDTRPLSYYTSSTDPTGDPATTFWRSAQDHQDNTKGHEWAFRADGAYDFDESSFLKRLKFGARYAHRSQTIRSDGYNWGNLSERWNTAPPTVSSSGVISPGRGGTVTGGALSPPGYGPITLDGFFGGPSINIFGFQGNPGRDYDQMIAGAEQIRAVNDLYCTFRPLSSGVRSCGGAPTPASLDSIANGAGDGFHNLGEISRNDEKTYSAYGRLDFSAENIGGGNLTIDGNIGLRFVHTKAASSGYFTIPTAQSQFGYPTLAQIPCGAGYVPPGREPGQFGYNICLNTPAEREALFTFFGNSTADGTYVPNTTKQSYNHWLPSFNLRVAPSKELQFRFAFSKAITRPSFNDVRNYTKFSLLGPVGTLTVDQPYPTVAVKAVAYGNPFLRPTKSDNYDLTAEYYYSPSGSITLTGFFKRLTNVYSVVNGIATERNGIPANIGVDPATPTQIDYTNNGVTQTAFVSVTANNNLKYNIKGFEVDWRQTRLPFLPEALQGFGIQANFTYIDADKLKNQPIGAANYDSSPGTGYNPQLGYLATLPFPGISKYNANAELFYEQYGLQARIAYTWRSKYFVSYTDSLGPNDPTWTNATGFVDASIFYAITPNIKIGVTGSNLFDETIKTYNVINREGLQALRGINKADRRFTAGVRVGF
jgi:TonB-dependent receptor